MTLAHKFDRCMVFAGGGFRFGAYLGMYAAACDAGKPPDILLASCGGAIAAAIVHTLPDNQARKAWLCSRAMYDYCRQATSTQHAALHRVLWRATQRRLSGTRVQRIPDLFSEHLFEPPKVPMPMPSGNSKDGPALAIIGAKLLFEREQVSQLRRAQSLFAETIFAPKEVCAMLAGQKSALHAGRWPDSAIRESLAFEPEVPLDKAALISTADIYYFPAVSHLQHHYSGGALNLFPIELAHQLGREVIMEFKAPLDAMFALPAWRSVFGIDGNARLREVHQQFADYWIDTSDIRSALRSQQVQKKLDWYRGRIKLVAAENFDTYIEQMEAQWQFGYDRAREAFARKQPNDQSGMRVSNRHNQARSR